MKKSTEGEPTIVGIGSYLPKKVVSNEALRKQTGIRAPDRAIVALTGIRERHFVAEEEYASDMATAAIREALFTARTTGDSVHTLILATDSPDYLSPNTASIVNGNLELPSGILAYDLKAACAGGVMALDAAASRVARHDGQAVAAAANILSSRILTPPFDQKTVIIFGDGAGAAVIENRPESKTPVFVFDNIPNQKALGTEGGGERFPLNGPDDPRRRIHMDGRTVSDTAIPTMRDLAIQAAQEAGVYDDHRSRIDWDQIALFVPHQANGKLVDAVADALDVPSEKRVKTIETHGNTSASTIFLALDHAYQKGEMPPQGRVLFTAFGAGFVAGAGVMNVDIKMPPVIK